MAISYVNSATGTTSATIPTHQVGDLIVAVAYRDGSTTAPSLPGSQNWSSPGTATGGGSTNSIRVAWKIARTTSETTGTFTNATSFVVAVYRGALRIGGINFTSGSSTTVSYPTVSSMARATGTSWAVGAAGHRSTDTNLQNAPTGMTFRNGVADATDEIALHDTNGGVSSWSNQNVSVGGTSSGWVGVSFELVAKYALADYEAIRAAVAAGTTHAGFAVLGDSVAAGCDYTANAMRSNARTGSFAKLLADGFQACPADANSFYLSSNVYAANSSGGSITGINAYDSRLSMSASWECGETPGDIGVGGAAFFVNTGTTGTDLSFNPGVSFDRITAVFSGYSGSPQNLLRINGTTAVATLAQDQVTDGVYNSTHSVTAGTHTVQIRSAGTFAFHYGNLVWTAANEAMHFVSCAAWGATLGEYSVSPTAFAGLPTLTALFQAMVSAGWAVAGGSVHMGGNDIAASATETQFKDRLRLITAAIAEYGHPFLFGQVWGDPSVTGISETTANTVNTWVEAVANEYGATYFNLRTLTNWDTFANADAAGFHASDNLHLSATGTDDLIDNGYLPILDDLGGATSIALPRRMARMSSHFR